MGPSGRAYALCPLCEQRIFSSEWQAPPEGMGEPLFSVHKRQEPYEHRTCSMSGWPITSVHVAVS